jgi:outer membrane lipoprotein-sorting protein
MQMNKMKKINFFLLVFLIGTVLPGKGLLQAQDNPTAKEIIDRANQLMRGNSSYAEMTMKIIRPKWDRTLSFKAWSKGTDLSLIYITEPAKESGQVFLKREKEMWNWVPSIERMIKIPPSMMMQSWMGSDMTNDDLVKESSIVEDYSHTLIGTETIEEYDCYKIQLEPHEDAPVVWGKIISWISRDEYFTLKNEYYDEDGYLVNREILSKIKNVGDRVIPTYFEIIPVDKEGQKTTMEFTHVTFNVPMEDDFFSIQNMRRVR